MHWRLNQTIEQNLFRAHLADASSLLSQLLHESLPLLGIFILANALAIVLAQVIWHRYVNAMLIQFMALVEKTQQLDFSPDPEEMKHRYELLTLAEIQRTKERQRLAAIREQISNLEAEVSVSANPPSIRQALNSLENLLPHQTG